MGVKGSTKNKIRREVVDRMKDLLTYLIKEITGDDDFAIEEHEENNHLTLNILAKPDNIGLIIGKNGSTIKAIQVVSRVKGTLENKSVFVNVVEKAN